METDQLANRYDPLFVRNMIESALRIGFLVILLIWSYDIIEPFVVPIVWGAIIAMAAFPLVKWLQPKVGGRRGLAAGLVSTFFILILVIPAWSVTDALLGGIRALSAGLKDGSLSVPPPNAAVEQWPVIGERLYAAWSAASSDLETFLVNRAEQIRELSGGLLRRIGGSLLGVLMFVISIVIAGGFMTYAESCGHAANRFFIRVGGLRPGGEWAPLTVATVRGVLQGVVGIAVIQTLLITLGLLVAGVPATPLWAAIVLMVAIAQLPPMIVLLPIILWVFSTADPTTAIIFAVYQVFAGLSDTFLKPLLLGRGLDIPMPVILVGAIGGMLASGIIGLFAGAVILSIWYKLFGLWLAQQEQPPADAPAAPQS